MVRYNFFACLLFCLAGSSIFFSCKTKTNSLAIPVTKVDSLPTHAEETDPVLNQFKKQFADTVPKPVNFVSDYDDLLNPSQEDSLNILAADADKKGIAQIAVVTFTGSMVRKETLDSLSLKIAKEWGVGHKDTNNGIFIGICKDCKRISIRNGLGIEKTLTDSATKVILDKYILPPFKQGQYFKGVWDGTKALLDKLK